jgi:hypothetical protein
MIGFFRRLIQRYGFFKREVIASVPPWQEHPFFSEAAHKSRRLAQIARERDALKERLAKAIRDKKARAPIYQALRALSVEELNLEAGK